MGNGLEYGVKITVDGKLAIAGITGVDKGFEKLDKRVKAFSDTAEKQARATDKATRATRQMAQGSQDTSSKLASLERQTRVQTRAVVAATRANERQINSMIARTQATERMVKWGRRAEVQDRATAASALNVRRAFQLVTAAITARSVLGSSQTARSLDVAYQGVAKSVREGAEELEFVSAISERLGLVNLKLANSYLGVFAASQDTNLEGEQTRKIFLGVNAAVRALGKDGDSAVLAIRAIEQMMSKGKVQAEELRGQLGDHLPGAFKLAAEASGETEAEFNKMLERGEVLAEDILPKLADILIQRYLPTAELMADESEGQVNRIINAWQRASREVGQSINTGFAQNADELRATLDGLGDSQALEALGTVLGEVTALTIGNADAILVMAAGYATARASTIALEAAQATALGGFARKRLLVGGLSAMLAGNFTKAAQAATLAWRGLTTAMLANPIGLVAAAVGLGVAAWISWGVAAEDAADKTDQLVDANARLSKALDEVAVAAKGGETQLLALLQVQEDRSAAEAQKSEEAAHALVDLLARRRALQDQIRQEASKAQQAFDAVDIGGRIVRDAPEGLFEMRQELAQVIKEIAAYEGQLASSNAVMGEVETKITEINKTLSRLSEEERTAVNEKLLKHFQGLQKSLDPVANRLEELATAQLAVDAALAAGQITRDQHAAYLKKLNDELFPDANALTAIMLDDLKREADLIGVSNKTRTVELALRARINEAKRRGVELTEENVDALRSEIAAIYDAKEAADARIDAEEKAAKRLENLYKNAAENIQRALSDAIYDGLNGSLDSVGDFFKELADLWKRNLAEQISFSILKGNGGGLGSLFGLGNGFLPGDQPALGPVAAPGTGGGLFGIFGEGVQKFGDIINGLGKSLGFGTGEPTPLSLDTLNGPLEVPGAVEGTTLLGSLGQGAGIGLVLNGLLGGDSTGGAIGGAVGSAAGEALFGPLGGLIGGALGGAVGGFFSSIFGSKKPRAGTTLSIGADGQILNSTPRTYDGKGDPAIATGLAGLFRDQLNSLASVLGAELRAGLQLGEIGYRKDLFVFDPTANARIKDFGEPDNDRDTQTFETEEEAVRAALANALAKGVITGVGEEVQAYLRRTTTANLDTVLANLEFLKVYDDLTQVNQEMSEVEKAIKSLNQQFIDAARQADKLGLAVQPIFDAWEAEIEKLRNDFNKDVDLAYQDLVDPARAELSRLRDEQINRLTEAVALGVDLAKVQQLNAKEWELAIERLDSQVNAFFNRFSNNLDSFNDSLKFGANSSLSPIEQLQAAQERFNDLVDRVRGGDEAAGDQVFEAARILLDITRDALGSSSEYRTQESFVQATLENLRDQLPRTDVSAIAGELGTAALTDQQVANITNTIQQGQDQMIALLDEIANNTAPGLGTTPGTGQPGGFGSGGGYFGSGPRYFGDNGRRNLANG